MLQIITPIAVAILAMTITLMSAAVVHAAQRLGQQEERIELLTVSIADMSATLATLAHRQMFIHVEIIRQQQKREAEEMDALLAAARTVAPNPVPALPPLPLRPTDAA